MLKYRTIEKEDLQKWEELARSEFLERDFCSAEYFLKHWDKIKGWILLTADNEWIGCCFIDTRHHIYNPGGVHFLEHCVFPKFRNGIYGVYLLKIMFDNSIGFRKSACVSPNNSHRIGAMLERVGFIKQDKQHSGWNVYICEKDYYPKELEKFKLPLSQKRDVKHPLSHCLVDQTML